MQDIDAHLHGGIPACDVDSMQNYWSVFKKLKNKLFSVMRDGYYQLNVNISDVRNTIYNDEEFSEYADKIDNAFEAWQNDVDERLRNIKSNIDVKKFIVWLSDKLIEKFEDIELVDKYDVYEVLLSYWQEVMEDDVFLIKYDGYEAGKEVENIVETTENKKGEKKEKIKGWEGKLIPKAIIEKVFFAEERKKIDDAQAIVDETQNRLDEFVEENTGDDGVLSEYLNDKDAIDTKAVNAKLKELKKTAQDSEEYKILLTYTELSANVKEYTKIVKELNAALDEAEKAKYAELTIEEVKELLVNHKWYYTIFDGISELYSATSHNMANRISELANRYEVTLPSLEKEVEEYEAKVKSHLERMGFSW